MPERRPLINPTVHIASSLHDADGLALNENGEVQGYKDLSRFIDSVTVISDNGPSSETEERGRTVHWRLDGPEGDRG